jgi:ER-bound oxygenase mpaB/B'/Rubber oxygenase, catalytic domain
MVLFRPKDHIIRKIWGSSDTVLLIFAGSAAEFALNKAVDWLYYTGKIPADPIGRLFSTVQYAQKIIFSEESVAFAAIDTINTIHGGVEKSRGDKIPDWAYRDVLFMLVHYSIAAFELLQRKLTPAEKEDVYAVFLQMGNRMFIKDLPASYSTWKGDYATHLQRDLVYSDYSKDLFLQYKKHLGSGRFYILKEAQKLILPVVCRTLLQFEKPSRLRPLLPLYKLLRALKADWLLKTVLLPKAYHQQIKALDQQP